MNLDWLLLLRIDHRPFLGAVDLLMAAAAVILLVRPLRLRPWLRALVPVAGGAVVGLVTVWVAGDVLDVFGVPLSPVTRMWVAIAFAGVALAVSAFWQPIHRWRKVVAAVAIPVMLIGAAAGINVDFGAYRDLHDALGISPYGALPAGAASGTPSRAPWRPPADLPAHGLIGTVEIPATTSGFHARPAVVYLPPAARTAHPPRLPVIVMLSGQPGAPADMFASGRAATVLDAYAARHEGLAPIVVAPDQLGTPDRNPMCVDSPLGRSQSYLTVDVPAWIQRHLPVLPGPASRAIVGYSEGGTCAAQLGAGYPELFGSLFSISGELAPTIGQRTVTVAFGGSSAAYRAQQPLHLLAAHRPYRDSFAIFAAGSADAKFSAFQRTTYRAASTAGMTTRFISSPGTAHDWNTVRYALRTGLPALCDHLFAASAGRRG